MAATTRIGLSIDLRIENLAARHEVGEVAVTMLIRTAYAMLRSVVIQRASIHTTVAT